jgi:glucan phosphoethanolaminetransferase (alkaline phosphatase superfamily)
MKHKIASLALDMAAWFVLPLIFTVTLLVQHAFSLAAASMHLYVIALLVATVLLAKSVLQRLGIHALALRLVFSALQSALLLGLAVYYVVVHIVLDTWGKVVSEELLINYSHQLPELFDVAGLSLPATLAGLALAYAALFTLCDWLQRRKRHTGPAPQPGRTLVIVLLASLMLLTGYRLAHYLGTPGKAGEPINLTLHSGKAGGVAMSFRQGLQVADSVNAIEERIRASYHPGSGAASNLVLIVVDDLRYDHMGVYGYGRDTTPYLSQMARAGQLALVARAHAACAETTCGLSSLAASRNSHAMPDKPFSLTRVLKRHGYQVRLILGDNQSVSYLPEVLYGEVDQFVDAGTAKARYNSDDSYLLDTTRELPAWNQAPAMLQYHLMAAHTLGTRRAEFQRFVPAERYAGKVSGAARIEHTNHYDNGVLQADAEIRQLLDTLARKGYLRDALVVVTADHGESLGEHGLFSHTNGVYEPLLHIPLLFAQFKDGVARAPGGLRQDAAQIDIAPTILRQLGLPIPQSWAGVPLQQDRQAEFTYFQMVPFLGLYDHRDPQHRWKFWVNTRTGVEFAFDLSQDPNESDNRALHIAAPRKALWRTLLKAAGALSAPTAPVPPAKPGPGDRS